jgi:hypothetical protein
MYKVIKQIFLLAAIAVMSISAFGQKQSQESKEALAPTASANTQIVGIDPTKNVVTVQNSTSGPLSVSVANTTGRVPFQIQGGFQIFAGGPSSSTEVMLVIPDGKRFVIENITARFEIPTGENVEMSFLSRIDTTPNGNAMYQYVPIVSQGPFVDKTVLMASHKTLAYAAYRLPVRVRPTWTVGVGYANFTFTGYLENLSQ